MSDNNQAPSARDLVPFTDEEIQASYVKVFALTNPRARTRRHMPSPLDPRSLRTIQMLTSVATAIFGMMFLAGMSRSFSYWGEAAWVGGIMTLLALGFRLSPDVRATRAFAADDPLILLPVIEKRRSEIEAEVTALHDSLLREKASLAERVHQMDARRQTVTREEAEWDTNLAAHREGYSLEERRLRRMLSEAEIDLADLEQESTAVLRSLDLARSLIKYPDAGALLADAALVDESVESHIAVREAEVAEFQARMESVRGQMTSLAERLAVGMRG